MATHTADSSSSAPSSPAAPHARRRTRLIAFTALAAVVSVFVAYAAIARIGYGVIATPANVYPFATPTGEFQDITFPPRGRSDYAVHGFLLTPETPNGMAIVNAHGRFGSRLSSYQRERAELLRGLGYTVLSPDLADNGGTTVEDGRSSMGYDEQWDVLGAYDALIERGFAPESIGFVAESMGAATILNASQYAPRARAFWADSGYTDALGVIREQSASAGFSPIFVSGGAVWGWLLAGDRLWEVSPGALGPSLAANGQAVYLVHCQGDTIVFDHHSADLETAYRAAGVDVTRWDNPCQRHTEALWTDREAYLARLDAFMRAHLTASPPTGGANAG
jgi:dienelactone hydrolase